MALIRESVVMPKYLMVPQMAEADPTALIDSSSSNFPREYDQIILASSGFFFLLYYGLCVRY